MKSGIVEDFCSFCEQTDEDRIIYRTENFFVRICLGQIIEGYLLIIPNEHYHCIGALPEELKSEYFTLKEKVRNILEKAYGSCIFYEHGRVGYCNVQPGQQICYHAHTHAVALNGDLMHYFLNDGLYPIKTKTEDQFFEVYNEIGHYLFYENNEREQYMIPINQPIRRQYLRSLVAQYIGNEKLADWESYPEWKKILRTKNKLEKEFIHRV